MIDRHGYEGNCNVQPPVCLCKCSSGYCVQGELVTKSLRPCWEYEREAMFYQMHSIEQITLPGKRDFGSNLGIPFVNIDFH